MNQGFCGSGIQEYEIVHREIARRSAAEGMVLLKNDNHLLPLKKGMKIALFGGGAEKTVKGGTGSGDVNERETISIRRGLENAGFIITTKRWLDSYEQIFKEARELWKECILSKANQANGSDFFDAYSTTPFCYPDGDAVYATEAETAVYVISRIAGEGIDRKDEAGDFRLLPKEETDLFDLNRMYTHILVIINTGSIIDLSFLDQNDRIEALLYVVQPGMEGGHAVADILSGESQPSGKLTDTWAMKYRDYPGSDSFSDSNGATDCEVYEEGIYVGYRYFDSFEVPVRYCFGYGLSYTDFEIAKTEIKMNPEQKFISVKANVKNTGDFFPGKEIVQVYVSCPYGKIEKEYRRLVGFAKTRKLAPGEEQEICISFSVRDLASYDESVPGWIAEKGYYGIWIGWSLQDAELIGLLSLNEDAQIEHTENVCRLRQTIKVLELPGNKRMKRYEDMKRKAEANHVPVLSMESVLPETKKDEYSLRPCYASVKAKELVLKLTQEQMTMLVTGDVRKGQGTALGSAGIDAPGSAGQTSACAENLGIGEIILADGPAGLRLEPSFRIENGTIQKKDFCCSIEHGFFGNTADEKGEVRCQYCTAFPVGTLIAQSWDLKLAEEIGRAVAEEMKIFGITLWLAPGMNIHRNPLCGRNFEYYSEDPILTGRMAASLTQGVQGIQGCGTTIKHFACNNSENNRMASDSIITERTLREIYLRGFEIAVKESQPYAIMASYNMINGIHSANNHELCTFIARNEWGFRGLIVTDWCSTTNHPGKNKCTAAGCIRAGNDLIMPGAAADLENIRFELNNGTLDERDLQVSCMRIVDTILKS